MEKNGVFYNFVLFLDWEGALELLFKAVKNEDVFVIEMFLKEWKEMVQISMI